jgi:hypothetical protein
MFGDLNENLIATLDGLGFPVDEWEHSPPRVLAAAPPEKLAMGKAYQQVNDELESLLRSGPLWLRHVTGEARALIDPAHRRILRWAAAMGQPGELGCHFEWEGKATALDFLGQQRGHWGPASWIDLIDIIGLLAQGVVSLYLLIKPQDIHFSVFGQRHVLLQDRHHHPTEKKWVWFIECPRLAEHLSLLVDSLFGKARRISASSFDSLLSDLYSYETVELARMLSRIGELILAEQPGSPEERRRLKTLSSMGFVAGRSGSSGRLIYSLTNSGAEWLDNMSNYEER